jgi:protein tyrosine/serine phosphatase
MGSADERGFPTGNPQKRSPRWVLVLFLLLAGVVGAGVGLRVARVDAWALLLGCTTTPASVRHGPEAWATAIERPGLPNLHRVSADLYRGAQPTAEGMQELKKLGVRTVVNLRALHSDRDEIGDTGLAHEEISFKAWHPEDEDVVRFLRIVTDRSSTPVFVHCQYGSDRTGTMCAVYRIVVQGWSKEEALAEMTQGGFGFHEGWQNLADYINGLDVSRLRREAGISVSP